MERGKSIAAKRKTTKKGTSPPKKGAKPAAKRAKPAAKPAKKVAPAKKAPAAKAKPPAPPKAPKAAGAPSKSRFVWVDLMTKDPVGAQSFYKGLLGWGTKDVDVAPPMN